MIDSIATPTLWALTIGAVLALLVVDFVATRKPHEVSMKEALAWSAFYVALPLLFGGYVWSQHGGDRGVEYYTGYLVEKTLSVDNLFVFMLLLGAFAVPKALQQRVLLYGIVGALVLRGLFIALGAAALSAFDWVFLVFGLVLLATGVKVLRDTLTDQHAVDVSKMRSIALRPALPARHRGVRRPTAHGAAGGATCADPVRPGRGGRLRHRHRVRDRLGAGGLRHHRGPLPGLRDQRLRPAGAAGAVLRARSGAEQAGAPRLRTGRDPRLHRHQAGAALGAPQLGGSARDPHAGLARGDHRHPGHGDRDQPAGDASGAADLPDGPILTRPRRRFRTSPGRRSSAGRASWSRRQAPRAAPWSPTAARRSRRRTRRRGR